MRLISLFAMPVMIVGIVVFGLIKRVRVYDCFLEGANEGLRCTFNIIAPLLGLVVAISTLRSTGAVDLIARLLSPVINVISMPARVVPLALLRPVSGSGSLAIVSDIFKTLGPDSPEGKIASVMMGSTETTFYTLAVYFGAVNIRKTRHTLKSALIGDAIGMIMSVFVARWLLM